MPEQKPATSALSGLGPQPASMPGALSALPTRDDAMPMNALLATGLSGPNALLMGGFSATEGQKQRAAMWSPGFVAPAAPPDYLFPVSAFQLAGRALWPDWSDDTFAIAALDFVPLPELPEGSFNEDGSRKPHVATWDNAYWTAVGFLKGMKAPPKISRGHFTRSDWETVCRGLGQERERFIRATIRRSILILFFAEACARGQIAAIHRPKGGGRPGKVETEWWQVDNIGERLEGCDIDPDRPFDTASNQKTSWIFFESQSLDRAIAARKSKNSPTSVVAPHGVHYSPYLLLLLEAAKVSGIGPEPERQPLKGPLETMLLDMAKSRDLELSDRLVASMATILREPESREGKRTVLAKKKKQGCHPSSS